jgi:hypothetical protein|tara:strand:+ start:100 stop:267 length:168 start_codon:yes stop_codon:yes gene_type:complete
MKGCERGLLMSQDIGVIFLLVFFKGRSGCGYLECNNDFLAALCGLPRGLVGSFLK